VALSTRREGEDGHRPREADRGHCRFERTAEMVWLGIALTLLVAVAAVLSMTVAHHPPDLGALSDRWVARHRGEASALPPRTF
jgi:hypothetical protein